MKEVQLKDVCTFINGDRGKNYPSADKISKENIGVPFINAGLLSNNLVDWENMNYISEETFNKLGSGKIQKDDILYCLRGSLGKHAIIDFDGNGAIASSLVILRCNKEIIDPRFLLIQLDMDKIILQQNQANNGSSQPNLSANSVKQYNIKLTDMEKQKEIIYKFNKITEIIKTKKEQVENLELLVKSQFVEFFGDVIKNEKNFLYKRIDEVSTIVTGTTPDTSNKDYWDGDVKWITPAEIEKNAFYIKDTERKLTEEGRKSKALTIMPIGTVLFTSRAPIGKTAIAGSEMCCNQGFKNCICTDEINNIYLYSVLKYNAKYFDNLGTGATFRELSKSNFSKIQISIPPIELQNQFAEFVKLIDKQKFEIEKSLKEIEELYDSLMEEYFG